MRITLYRSNGLTVDPMHKVLFLDELNKKMDELEEEMGKCNQDNAADFQKILVPLHEELTKKYPISTRIKLPSSGKSMRELIEHYGSVCFCLEDGKIIGYVMDQ